MSFQLEVSTLDLSRVSGRLSKLMHQLKDLSPFMREASQYMLRSSKYRIRQGDKQPDGSPMPALAELTRLLKGHDQPLFQTGALYRGTDVTELDAHHFVIEATARNPKTGKDYAPYVQHGVGRPRGSVKTPDGRWVSPRNPIPARPFLGFSDENIRRLSRMLRDHIEKQ